jgi:transcriptional regulator with XRE-family HTH domain
MDGETAVMLVGMAERNGTDPDPRHRADLVPFARWLAERMRERRLGRNQLAEYLGISQSSISEYARALRRPRLETLRKLSTYFGAPLEELEALLPSEEFSPVMATPDTGRDSLGSAPVADWLKDPDLRLMFYGITNDLTPEEIESIKPILWKEYLAILARRGGHVEGGGPPWSGSAP